MLINLRFKGKSIIYHLQNDFFPNETLSNEQAWSRFSIWAKKFLEDQCFIGTLFSINWRITTKSRDAMIKCTLYIQPRLFLCTKWFYCEEWNVEFDKNPFLSEQNIKKLNEMYFTLDFAFLKWHLCCCCLCFFFIPFARKKTSFWYQNCWFFISAQLEEIPLIYVTNAVYEARSRAHNSYHVQYNFAYN